MGFTNAELQELKENLKQDAEKALEQYEKQPDSLKWIDPEQWRQYCGHGVSRVLYNRFTDAELLDILRAAAARLGRNPSKKDVFCVYRVFILRRFEKWPWALVAAGLKEPKPKKHPDRKKEGSMNL